MGDPPPMSIVAGYTKVGWKNIFIVVFQAVGMETYIRNKMAQIYALVFVVDYPSKVGRHNYGRWLLDSCVLYVLCAVASLLCELAGVCAVCTHLECGSLPQGTTGNRQ